MKILEYDQVDPLQVLHLNLLCLRYALTPERVALIRSLDPRPFPFFALYAAEENAIAGQVGVFRLPMMTTKGPEDVGGVWAVSTHPAFSRRGVATRLLGEAHARMRAAGLRFSTLGTSSHLGAHALYLRLGYEDVLTSTSALAERKTALCSTDLGAERAAKHQLHLADGVFEQVASHKLGFARRHHGFMSTMIETGELNEGELWLISRGAEIVGYAIAKTSEAILGIREFLLVETEDAASAISALAARSTALYVSAMVRTPANAASLGRAGYRLASREFGTFMVKPLSADISIEDANRLMGIGTERFMISVLDTT